jgi:hypothetical protein
LFEYYHYFQTVKNHPWNRLIFAQNIVFEAMLLTPLLCMYVLFTPKLPRAFKWFLATLVFSITLVTYPAAESGAGVYHLLPFLPSVVWGFVLLRREVRASLLDVRARGRYESLAVGLIAALLLGYGPIVITSWRTVLQRVAEAPLVSEGIAEIDRALDENPGLKVAVGPGAAPFASFDAQSLRVLPVFRGNPLPIDPYSWMFWKLNGASEEMVVGRAIRRCRVDLWLLPSAAPFVMTSHYDGSEIFSPEVRGEFYDTYEKQRSGRVFDQWRCNGHG